MRILDHPVRTNTFTIISFFKPKQSQPTTPKQESTNKEESEEEKEETQSTSDSNDGEKEEEKGDKEEEVEEYDESTASLAAISICTVCNIAQRNFWLNFMETFDDVFMATKFLLTNPDARLPRKCKESLLQLYSNLFKWSATNQKTKFTSVSTQTQ